MKRILAVDDDADFLEELGMALEVYDYDVVISADPLEAIKQAQIERPDCILVDLKMPKVNGFKFSEALNKETSLKDIPVIAMSGCCSSDQSKQLAVLGVNRFLRKPLTPNECLSMIRSSVK